MAKYQSTHTGAEIDEGIDLLGSNSARQGQVLTANGTGGASWQDMDMEIPIVAGEGITIDKQSAEGKVEVKLDTAFTDGKYLAKKTPTDRQLYAYAVNQDGQQILEKYTNNPIPWSIVRRNGAGQSEFARPTENAHAATKKYVDDGFVPIAQGRLQLYGTDPSTAGKVHMYQITPTPTSSGIPQYGTNGVLKVGTPVGQSDAATKAYVDDLQHYVHTISLEGSDSQVYITVAAKGKPNPIIAIDEDGSNTTLATLLFDSVYDQKCMATGVVQRSGSIGSVVSLSSDGSSVNVDYILNGSLTTDGLTYFDLPTITDTVV